MHLPDGFLDTKTWLFFDIISAFLVWISLRKTGRELEDRRIPLLGVLAAFIFAAQMVNFPVIGGTSGHLVGGVLAALLVGPWPGFLIMTVVLLVQAIIFSDGGILALGANIFNMAFAASFLGYYLFMLFRYILKKETWAVFSASVASIVLAAIFCVVQLGMSGVASFWPVFFTMTGLHILIGIGEGLITTAIFLAVKKIRPDLIYEPGH